jgi:hypothetical protein
VREATVTLAGPSRATRYIDSVASSPSGATLAVVADGPVDLLDADPGALADRLCSYTGGSITVARWRRFAPDVSYRDPCLTADPRLRCRCAR